MPESEPETVGPREIRDELIAHGYDASATDRHSVRTVTVRSPDDPEEMYEIVDEMISGVTDIRMTCSTRFQLIL
jgi:hypothetical protein